jgi:hypothetical protein
MKFGQAITATAAFYVCAHVACAAEFTTIFVLRAGHMPAGPTGPIVVAQNGALYGTGESSGIFELQPPASPGDTWTETTISNNAFIYGPPLAMGPDGSLYSVEQPVGYFKIFQLAPPAEPGGAWTETVLYTFNNCVQMGQGCTNAGSPVGLAVGPDGTVYGASENGGTSSLCTYGCGMIFTLTPPSSPGGIWAESMIFSFGGGPDGANPSGLTIVPDGTLYVPTKDGGRGNEGAVFALHPAASGGAWTGELLYSFQGGKYGTAPYGPLALDQDGTLYGTAGGGTGRSGLVFGLEPPAVSGNPWRASVIHIFGSHPSGRIPAPGLVVGSGGAIYGATEKGGQDVGGFCKKAGCGTVFELLPTAAPGGSWTESLIHTFTCRNDGCQPFSGLVQGPDGFIYGTTSTGGDSGNGGTVYQVQP